MKIRDVIKLIESDGWYLVTIKEAIGNTSIPKNPGVLRLLGIQVTIWHWER